LHLDAGENGKSQEWPARFGTPGARKKSRSSEPLKTGSFSKKKLAIFVMTDGPVRGYDEQP
jgi:hypothetical protein